MVLATIFCLTSFIIFLCQLFTLVKGGRFFLTAVFQILASLFVMSGAIIYTVMSEKKGDESWGYAFVLAWLAFPLTLISGFIYIVLRKKEWKFTVFPGTEHYSAYRLYSCPLQAWVFRPNVIKESDNQWRFNTAKTLFAWNRSVSLVGEPIYISFP